MVEMPHTHHTKLVCLLFSWHCTEANQLFYECTKFRSIPMATLTCPAVRMNIYLENIVPIFSKRLPAMVFIYCVCRTVLLSCDYNLCDVDTSKLTFGAGYVKSKEWRIIFYGKECERPPVGE